MTARTSAGDTVTIKLPWGVILSTAAVLILAMIGSAFGNAWMIGEKFAIVRADVAVLQSQHIALREAVKDEAERTRNDADRNFRDIQTDTAALASKFDDLDKRLRVIESNPPRVIYGDRKNQ